MSVYIEIVCQPVEPGQDYNTSYTHKYSARYLITSTSEHRLAAVLNNIFQLCKQIHWNISNLSHILFFDQNFCIHCAVHFPINIRTL